MLKNCDLIVFSDDWGRHSFSCQHIFERLIPFNRVIWVNTVGYRPIKFTRYDAKRAWEKISNWVRPLPFHHKIESITDINIRILDPVCLPFGAFSLIRKFNAFSIIRSVRNASKILNFQRPLLVTSLPTSVDSIVRLREFRTVYYCVDDFTVWPGEDGVLMRNLEERLLRKVDLVIATSEKLQRTRSNGIRPTKLLTHGVDLQHFRSVGSVPPAIDVQNLAHPVIGYYGLIDERCDLSLIAELARSLVHVNFLIIGPWKVSQRPLEDLPNVKIVGKVAYSQLPAYLAPVDLLMLPYHVNDLAEAMNPLKIKEYLATGLPVVSTPLPEVVKLRNFLHIASSAGEFKRTVLDALGREKFYSAELDRFLQGETWEAKANLFSHMLEEIL